MDDPVTSVVWGQNHTTPPLKLNAYPGLRAGPTSSHSCSMLEEADLHILCLPCFGRWGRGRTGCSGPCSVPLVGLATLLVCAGYHVLGVVRGGA